MWWCSMVGMIIVAQLRVLLVSSSSKLSDCCHHILDPPSLVECAKTARTKYAYDTPHKVAFVSFASNDILYYASHTFMLNSNYANYCNYSFTLLTETETDLFPQDRRWNKIGAVVDALNPGNGWARNVEYLVAVDADLLVMDYSLDIAEIASKYPKAHLLMSSDSSDIGNTGFMIVKNTKWAHQFFTVWWELRLSTFACDQHALNDLYARLQRTKTLRHRVAILPPSEVNTAFPVYQHYTSHSRVLHMVGERQEVREAVFLHAANYFCANAQSEGMGVVNDGHGAQLEAKDSIYGITPEVLRTLARGVKEKEENSLIAACKDYVSFAARGSVEGAWDEQRRVEQAVMDCMQKLHEKTAELCRLSDGQTDKCAKLFFNNYELAYLAGESIPFLKPHMYDFITKNLYDSFLYMADSLAAAERGMMVVGLLQDMRETYLHDASVNMLWPLLNRQARALSAVADMYMQLGHMRKSVAAARAALQKAMDMGNVRAGHADYEGYTQTRVICLRTLSESLSGLQNDASFNESIATIQEAVIIAEKLYSESVVETTRNAMLLVECLVSQLRKVPDALASILLSRRIRDVCSANSLPIESGLEQILLHYERKSSQTPMNIDSLS